MSFRSKLTFLFLTVTLLGCNPLTKQANVTSLFSPESTPKNGLVITIPISGCSGCVEAMLSFSKKNKNNANLFVILLGDDIKQSNYILSREFQSHSNFISRPLDSVGQLTLDSQFPMYYVVRSGKIVEESQINASNLLTEKLKLQEMLENSLLPNEP
ncbi:hypothetical protein [Roseivirga echinicomitans]|nr:hypothetical protein [Roseivirga echinicomitans]